MPILENARHERFARNYATHRNGTKAYIAAGYKDGPGAAVSATRMLKNPKIAARIEELESKTLKSLDITAERVMLEMARVAFSDVRKLFDENGKMRPLHELDDDTAAAISAIEVESRPETQGKGKGKKTIVVGVTKARLWDKSANLRMLAQRFKLIGSDADEALTNLAVSFADRVAEARQRRRGEDKA